MRAVLGVSDKTGLAELARGLHECGVELIATGGTARAIADSGVPVHEVSEVTGLPEMLDGRVKTLHPAIHAGILARRDRSEHLEALQQHCYRPIYEEVLAEIREAGAVQPATRRRLAAEAFAHVAAYDTAVADWLAQESGETGLRRYFTTGGALIAELRYGENPHQRGALYTIPGVPGGVAHARHLQGPALSFTNWLDADAAANLVAEFAEPAAAVIKHTNPCGFAIGDGPLDAYRRAHACDPRSAYGGIVSLNREIDLATAEELAKTFLEIVVCPAIDEEAARRLARKARLRVLVLGRPDCSAGWDVRSLSGGLLVQTRDRVSADRGAVRVISERRPTESEWRDLLVAWRVCPHVKSNAIVIVRDRMAVGVGAGQMSRVEAAELAVGRAGEAVVGASAASDAFFPLPDGLEALGRAGVRAVIHPGGSKNDAEVAAAADAFGLALVVTGERHFRH